MEDGILGLGVLLAIFVRWGVSLFPYSGQGKGPMFGDYEAQRHWQEITFNVPVRHWYLNNSKNDLQYWGLDYPPLTAYHSYLCGYAANKINSSWVKLFASRGTESYDHKLFMRSSVFAVDLLLYITAVWAYWYHGGQRVRPKSCAVTVMLLYPGLILIDHGHFQYNCVSLGLALWAILALSTGHDVMGAIAFSLALNYKQMTLYLALPFFCYLLGRCARSSLLGGIRKFVTLGVVVAAVFAASFYPYIWNMKLLQRVFYRLFPFGRGLYEDKVANIWCCLSVILKLKLMLSVQTLVKISTATTLLALIPSSFNLLRKPSVERFKLALVNSSLIFFLLSFQVHEKSILLVALPVCCLLSTFPLPSVWFLLISVYSMFPLLLKDGLLLPTVATCVIFYILAYNVFLRRYFAQLDEDTRLHLMIVFYTSLFGAVALGAATLLIPPPARYVDLHTMLCCMYSCAHFVGFTTFFHYKQLLLDDEEEYSSVKKNE